MSFLSDGTMFLTERAGAVKVRKLDASIATVVTPSDLNVGGKENVAVTQG
jgi:hypothetical protein